MTIAYLALGSNLGQPERYVTNAIAAIRQLPQTQLLKISSFYRSKPLGPQDQNDYLNVVLKIETALMPEQLLDATQHIELQNGRERKAIRWGARTLDVDILLFGEEIIHTERLIVPHYDMHNRNFVLFPLAEIAPDLMLPNGTPLQLLISQLDRGELDIWDITPLQ